MLVDIFEELIVHPSAVLSGPIHDKLLACSQAIQNLFACSSVAQNAALESKCNFRELLALPVPFFCVVHVFGCVSFIHAYAVLLCSSLVKPGSRGG